MSGNKEKRPRFYYESDAVPKTPVPEERLEPWRGETRIVGKGLPRLEAYEKVSGTAQYTHDVYPPDTLFAAILRCPHAHALVKRVDTGRASRMPGVRAVITSETPGADIPWPHTTWLDYMPKQTTIFDKHCRYAGDEVAAVAAETPQQARDALKAVEVEYEILPFVLDEESALAPGAPALHEGGNMSRQRYPVIGRGDIEAGFSEAEIIVEETFSTSQESHATMETHGSVVKWDGDKLTIWDSTQGAFEWLLVPAADALSMPLNNIRAVCRHMGGGFGSKGQLEKHTIIAALLSRSAGRPVRAILPREEALKCCGYRPAIKMAMKAGIKRDGTITALRMISSGSHGAYYEWTDVGFQAFELYRCANAFVRDSSFYTNTGASRPFRAPGFPTCSWALEQMIDMLAERAGIDPVEFRLMNIADYSQTFNIPFTSFAFRECLREGAEMFGWEQARKRAKGDGHIHRGAGVACGFWGGGGQPPATAVVKMMADGSVTLSTGATDLGTGTRTIAGMVAAEELRMPLERIRVEIADTDTTPYCIGSGGSRIAASLLPAVRRAAFKIRRQLLEWAAEDLELDPEELELRENTAVSRRDPSISRPVPELISARSQWDVVGVGYRGPNPEGKAIRTFAAHFAEVEVNTLTGEVRVLRMLGAHDSGRVANRKTYFNQVFGGMTQGLGFGLMEKRVVDRQTGKLLTANLVDYKVPTSMDVPASHQVLPIDPGDTECNITGCKGLGEPATVPTSASVANAIYDAVGVRVTDGPADPRRILDLLRPKRADG